jgi:hypothetical protein
MRDAERESKSTGRAIENASECGRIEANATGFVCRHVARQTQRKRKEAGLNQRI